MPKQTASKTDATVPFQQQMSFLTDSDDAIAPSAQTQLFRHVSNQGIAKSCSSADLLPFFLSGKGVVLRGAKEAPDLIRKRTILVGGNEAVLSQQAVAIKCRHGKDKGEMVYRHLGEREGRVLNGLKILASNVPSRSCWTGVHQRDKSVALYFSLGDLGKACKNRFNNAQLGEALETLQKSPTELIFYDIENDTAYPIKSPILPIMCTVETDNLDMFEHERFKNATYMCTFHPVISNDIANLNYRTVNAGRIDSRKSPLTRAIETRMSHSFIFASYDNTFNLSASRILKENGFWNEEIARKPQSVRYRTLRESAIPELTLPSNMTEDDDVDKVYIFRRVVWKEIIDENSGQVDDWILVFYPTRHFVKQQIDANMQRTKDKKIMDAAANEEFPIAISDINDSMFLAKS